MLFTYKDITYEVFISGKFKIVFCCVDFQQEYEDCEEFKNKANIDGRLLKDLWDDVTFAGFMYCG